MGTTSDSSRSPSSESALSESPRPLDSELLPLVVRSSLSISSLSRTPRDRTPSSSKDPERGERLKLTSPATSLQVSLALTPSHLSDPRDESSREPEVDELPEVTRSKTDRRSSHRFSLSFYCFEVYLQLLIINRSSEK